VLTTSTSRPTRSRPGLARSYSRL